MLERYCHSKKNTVLIIARYTLPLPDRWNAEPLIAENNRQQGGLQHTAHLASKSKPGAIGKKLFFQSQANTERWLRPLYLLPDAMLDDGCRSVRPNPSIASRQRQVRIQTIAHPGSNNELMCCNRFKIKSRLQLQPSVPPLLLVKRWLGEQHYPACWFRHHQFCAGGDRYQKQQLKSSSHTEQSRPGDNRV